METVFTVTVEVGLLTKSAVENAIRSQCHGRVKCEISYGKGWLSKPLFLTVTGESSRVVAFREWLIEYERTINSNDVS
jgi:hypothetical protein